MITIFHRHARIVFGFRHPVCQPSIPQYVLLVTQIISRIKNRKRKGRIAMQLISKEAAIEELQSIANTIKGVGEWERYFEGLKLGYLSAAKALDRLPIQENRTTAVRQYFQGNRYPEYGECSICHKPLVETSCGGAVTRDEIRFCWNCGAKFERSVCHA